MSACDDKQVRLTDRANELVTALAKESAALAADIQQQAKNIDPNIDTSGVDAWIGVDVDVEWKTVEFSLDLPEIEMVDQHWSLDLPQVTMREQTLIFHLPSIRMKTVKTGEYPETVCKMVTKDVGLGVKIDVPECTVRWSPIYVDMPEPFQEEHRIIIGVPEFRMDRTEFILGIPELSMQKHTFNIRLPQITVKQISVESKRAKEEGDILGKNASTRGEKLKETFRENAKFELGPDVAALFDCYQSELMQNKNDALKKFENGVNIIQSTITGMVSNKVPDDEPSLVRLKQSLFELIARRDDFAKTIEEKFVELGRQQQKFFDSLIGKAA